MTASFEASLQLRPCLKIKREDWVVVLPWVQSPVPQTNKPEKRIVLTIQEKYSNQLPHPTPTNVQSTSDQPAPTPVEIL